jgi:sulfur-carrier protein
MRIRVEMPAHLRLLARVGGEVELEVDGAVTIVTVVDALELRYPMLRGTLRDHVTKVRRPFIRFFVCGEDWSLRSPEDVLPEAVCRGEEALWIVGAIAGG